MILLDFCGHFLQSNIRTNFYEETPFKNPTDTNWYKVQIYLEAKQGFILERELQELLECTKLLHQRISRPMRIVGLLQF